MDDRQLLEAAAKAAGYDALAAMYGWDEISGGVLLDANDPPAIWNPLTDDGDALRLAVKLSINVVPNYYAEWHTGSGKTFKAGREFTTEQDQDDLYAATRRCIVRAAAEIGKGVAQPVGKDYLPEDNYYKTQAEAEEASRAAAAIGSQQ